jgi:hypothetical protein
MDSSVNTMMHAVRGYFRFAHIEGAQPMQVRHEAVDDDRHCDRGENERAQHRRQRPQPVAEHKVEDGQLREDSKPDHERKLVLVRRFRETEWAVGLLDAGGTQLGIVGVGVWIKL